MISPGRVWRAAVGNHECVVKQVSEMGMGNLLASWRVRASTLRIHPVAEPTIIGVTASNRPSPSDML